jgi:CHAT domain-containing protein
MSFQESIDPIYRDLIGLLLNPNRNAITPEDLQKALDVFESLQVAELDNFFKEACLTSKSIDIDRLDPQAAVIYHIILPDRLELIVSFPGGQLQHYTSAITRLELEKISNQLRQTLLIRASNRYYDLITDTLMDGISDRTFSIIIQGHDAPRWSTPAGDLPVGTIGERTLSLTK